VADGLDLVELVARQQVLAAFEQFTAESVRNP
jgi:hypothetical protein